MPPNEPSGLLTRLVSVIAQRPLTRPSTGSEISSLLSVGLAVGLEELAVDDVGRREFLRATPPRRRARW